MEQLGAQLTAAGLTPADAAEAGPGRRSSVQGRRVSVQGTDDEWSRPPRGGSIGASDASDDEDVGLIVAPKRSASKDSYSGAVPVDDDATGELGLLDNNGPGPTTAHKAPAGSPEGTGSLMSSPGVEPFQSLLDSTTASGSVSHGPSFSEMLSPSPAKSSAAVGTASSARRVSSANGGGVTVASTDTAASSVEQQQPLSARVTATATARAGTKSSGGNRRVSQISDSAFDADEVDEDLMTGSMS